MRSHIPIRRLLANVQSATCPRPRHRLAIASLCVLAALAATDRATAQMMPMPPVAMNDYGMAMENYPTIVNILSNDMGMPALAPSSVTIHNYPMFGDIIVNPTTGSVMYLPDPGFYGMDGFTYTVADVNGRVSNSASVMIMVMEDMSPPVITSFAAVRVAGNLWSFSGTVTDSELLGNLVTFGGLISGSTPTLADGSFSFLATLSPGSTGRVTAQATNDEGISSTIAYAYVINN